MGSIPLTEYFPFRQTTPVREAASLNLPRDVEGFDDTI
jgi:hypothetical protein